MTINEIFSTIRDWAVGKFQPKGNYVTETDLSDKGFLISETDPTVPEWAKQPAKPQYTKAEIGLEDVDNTSDMSKPVSTAQQAAIDVTYQQATGYTDKKIADLINGAPSTLDTLGEIAAAMQENADTVDALETAIGTKASRAELDSHVGNNTIHITASERQSWDSKQSMNGDAKDNTVTFTSGDTLNPAEYTDIGTITSGEKQSSLWNKVSLFAKNVRYLWKLLGNTSLAGIGDGTITGAISILNTSLVQSEKLYTSIETLGISSTYIPDIIAAIPSNTTFRIIVTTETEIYKNTANKLNVMALGSGILSIEKAGGYTRTIITENNTGGANGRMYLASINTNTKEVNGWYEIQGKLI